MWRLNQFARNRQRALPNAIAPLPYAPPLVPLFRPPLPMRGPMRPRRRQLACCRHALIRSHLTLHM